MTGEIPAERLGTERRFLSPLPRRRYDTAYAEPRTVHVAVPLITWKGVLAATLFAQGSAALRVHGSAR